MTYCFRKQGGRTAIGGLVVAFTLLLAPAAARAGNFAVTNTHNSGPGSLRKAITNANASSGSDTIAINTTGTLTLQSSLPQINTDVAITGPGKTQFTISGAQLYRPLTIHGGRKVSISKLEVADGRCNNACGSFGGGIANRGALTLTDVSVAANTASVSGGTNPGATGGGIWSNGTLNLVRTRVSGNTVSATGYTGQGNPYGGGIMNFGTLTVSRSTVNSNTARATGGKFSNVHGGGIQNSGILTVTRSTLTGNATIATGSSTSNGSYGAALGNTNSTDVHVSIDRSTIGANTATAGSPGISETGGVEAYGATFSITSSTIAHNSASFYANVFDSTTVDVKNTVIADPAGGSTNCVGNGMSSQGYNLADDSSCNLGHATDKENANPMLTSLAFHGGPTKTYGLKAGSPAIDRGRSSGGETVDQRGLKRPSDFGAIPNAPGGNGTDIGAFEVQDKVPPNTIIDSGPSGTTNDPTPTFTFHATEAGSTFQCRVDAGAYAACTSPRTTQHLTDGTHHFTVRARDAASNADPSPASRSFTVKTAAALRLDAHDHRAPGR